MIDTRWFVDVDCDGDVDVNMHVEGGGGIMNFDVFIRIMNFGGWMRCDEIEREEGGEDEYCYLGMLDEEPVELHFCKYPKYYI